MVADTKPHDVSAASFTGAENFEAGVYDAFNPV